MVSLKKIVFTHMSSPLSSNYRISLCLDLFVDIVSCMKNHFITSFIILMPRNWYLNFFRQTGEVEHPY